MYSSLAKIAACIGLATLAGCSSTPIPDAFMSHFSSARQDEQHTKCMTDHAMFNNRQLMVAPNAVENAWSYCVKQSDLWYPGKDDGSTSRVSWDAK